MSDRTRLEREWRRRVGHSPAALEAFDALYAAYAADNRHYHGVAHIKAMLWDLEAANMLSDANYLATWFHDAVYVAGMPDNEDKSAMWARETLPALGIDAATIDDVCARITATKSHARMDDEEADSFLDADMAILGAPADIYQAYAKGVRAEFAAIPEDMLNTGRAAFLKSVLTNERIFHTDAFFERYEAQARVNIKGELEHLANFI